MFGYGYSYKKYLPRLIDVFDPLSLNPIFLGEANDPSYLNSYLAGDFDGTADAINIDSVVSALSSTTQGTIAFWVKVPASIPPSTEVFFSFGDTDANSFIDVFITSGGEIGIAIVNNGTILVNRATTSNPLFANTWALVAIINDGTTIKININNVERVTTDTGTGTGNEWLNDVSGLDNGRIACLNYNSVGNTLFNESILDSVMIFSSSKSSLEISAIYNSGNGQSYTDLDKTGLVAYYGFDDSDNLGADSTGNYDGTEIGTPGSVQGKIFETIINDGEEIHTLVDKSTYSNNATQSIIINQPNWNEANAQMDFNGSTENLDNSTVLNDLTTTTSGSWIVRCNMPTAVTGLNNTLYGMGNTTQDKFILLYVDGSGYLRASLRVSGVGSSWALVSDAVAVSNGVTTELGVIHDGTRAYLTKDGAIIASTFTTDITRSHWINAFSGSLDNAKIGSLNRNSLGEALHFSGGIKRVFITDYDLSASQLSMLNSV